MNQKVPLSPTMKNRPPSCNKIALASPRKRCRTLEDANRIFITLLHAGQPRHAIACLKKCLHTFLSSARKSPLQKFLLSTSIRCQKAPEMEYCGEDRVSPDGAFVFFNQALIFNSIDDERCAASVILYNMGLVYHRQAIQCGRTDFYRTASQFYVLSQKTAPAPEKKAPEMAVQTSCYYFAVINNLGHVYSHLFQNDRAALCLQTLLNNRARYASVVAQQDFVLNTMLAAAPMA